MTSIERYYRPLFTDAGSESAVSVHEYGSAWTLFPPNAQTRGQGLLHTATQERQMQICEAGFFHDCGKSCVH